MNDVLTFEILLKSGFTKTLINDYIWEDLITDKSISMRFTDDFIYITLYNYEYFLSGELPSNITVGELQHIISGLNINLQLRYE